MQFYISCMYNKINKSKGYKECKVINMDMAKITSKGQITIPIDIRRKLGLKEGDKVLFIESGNNIILKNASQIMYEAQMAAEGIAEQIGVHNEDDVQALVDEVRYGRKIE